MLSVGILALSFKPLHNQYESNVSDNISPPFLERFPFQVFKNASHIPKATLIDLVICD